MRAPVKWFLLLGLLVTACSGPVWAPSVKNPEFVQTTLPGQGIVFKDDFSDPNSGWETWSDADGSFVGYQNGGMRILVKTRQFDYWTRPTGRRFADASLEVDAFKLAGPDDNTYGLVCRYQDRANFYAFVTSSDGYAGIVKVSGGVYQILSGAQLSYSPVLRQGDALNHLRVDCIGSTLALTVNGQVVAQAQDGTFIEGDVALLAGANAEPGVDIFFDNFVVYR